MAPQELISEAPVKDAYGTAGESIGSTSTSLIERVRRHDDEAWRRLVRLYGPLVGFWVRRKVSCPADVADVFQEVFRSTAAGIDRFEKDRPGGSFRGWLRTITRGKVADHFRRAGRQPAAKGGSENLRMIQGATDESHSEDSLEEDSAEATALQELRLRGLELIRAEFEDRTWRMFCQTTMDGRSAKDVASDFGVTPSAVRLAKSRVLKRLREELGDPDEGAA